MLAYPIDDVIEQHPTDDVIDRSAPAPLRLLLEPNSAFRLQTPSGSAAQNARQAHAVDRPCAVSGVLGAPQPDH